MSDPVFSLHFIEVRGVQYLRCDRELGGAEETDVRNRLNEAAGRLLRPNKDKL